MAKRTSGKARLVIKDSAGRITSISPEFEPKVLDNEESPVYFLNAPTEATSGDRKKTWRNSILSGRAGEVMELQYKDTSGITLGTTDMVFDLPGILAVSQKKGVTKDHHTLTLEDRITKDSTANPSQRGLDDDGDTAAEEWSAVLRFEMRAGEAFQPSGHFRAEIHDNV